MIETCSGCRFWKRGKGEIGSSYGDCRRRAPTNIKTGGMICEPYYAIFPATHQGAWCGEFESPSTRDDNGPGKLIRVRPKEPK